MGDFLDVLLIESDSETRFTIQLLFVEIQDCNVHASSSCKEALESPPPAVPQLILLAHDDDSYAVHAHIQLMRNYPSAFVICSLPSIQEELVQNYLEAGANLIVIKNEQYIRELTNAVKKARHQVFERKQSLLQERYVSQSDDEEPLSSLLAGTLQPDEMILHYRILEEIGEGGMGEIYRAQDLKLHRIVAIKVLPAKISRNEKMKQRLMREARAASALNHPNIVTIHSIEEERGILFIVMEYVEGQSLQRLLKGGPLEFVRVLNFGTQIAEALTAAHRIGVIHRDIKPANIMITGNDHVKLLDFGLAKRISGSSEENLAKMKVSDLTGVGTILGTVSYMSPEQTRGDAIDERSDIFSLGSVLYEAATGKLPFPGPSILAVLNAITTEAYDPPSKVIDSLPADFDRLIGRALEKKKEDRYASATQFATDLSELQHQLALMQSDSQIHSAQAAQRDASFSKNRSPSFRVFSVVFLLAVLISAYWFSKQRMQKPLTSTLQPIRSVAVLPMLNLSGDPDEEYFADGFTESLISDLAKVSDLKVISRTSSMHYKGTDKPLTQIAKELNVDGIVEGSVIRSGNRVRITAQLIRALTDTHLWAENYERAMGDILTVQSEIAQAITDEILKQTSPQRKEQLARKRPLNAEAYEAYLKGRYHWSKRTKEGLEKSVEYFRKAIQIQPDYGIAYSALADSYQVMGSMRFLPPKEYLPLSRAAAEKAVQLDDTLAEAHTSLAAGAAHEWRWTRAAAEYQKAIRLNNNYATAHHWYSILLLAMKDCNGAIGEIEKARDLDPVSFIINLNLLNTLSHCGKNDAALGQIEKTKELNPSHWVLHEALATVYRRMGRYDDSIAAYEKSWSIDERYAGVAKERAENLQKAYKQKGAKGYWETLLRLEQDVETPSRFVEATFYALLQEKDRAFASLEEAYENHDSRMFTIQFLPELENLRSDPRYTDLVRRMGF